MRSSVLYKPELPWIWLDVLSDDDMKWLPDFLYGAETVSVVRVLRGHKVRSFQALMDEFGAALQFFDGFGENWDALDECLRDLNEWLPSNAYILVITHPESVLEEEPAQLVWLRKTLEEVGDWWSKPVLDNGRFNRPAIPFHTVLQCTGATLARVQARFPGVPILPVSGDHA